MLDVMDKKTPQHLNREDHLIAGLCEALLETVDATTRLVDLDQQLPRVTRTLANVKAVDGCAILFWNEFASELTSQHSFARAPADGHLLSNLQLSAENVPTLASLTVTTALSNSSSALECLPVPHTAASKLAKGHLLLTPLFGRDKVFGALCLKTTKALLFKRPQPIKLLNGVARQVSAAIENSRLCAEAQKQALQWRVLAETGQEATSTFDLEAVLDSITERAFQLLAGDSAGLALLTDDGLTLEMQSSRGFRTDCRGLCLATGQGLIGLVAQLGSAVAIEDYQHDRRFHRPEGQIMRNEGFISFAGVPLKERNRLIGVLAAYSRTLRRFTTEDLELLQFLANQAVIAIDNSRLYRAVVAKKEVLESLVESSPDGILVIDSSYRVAEINQAMESISGWPTDEVRGKVCREVFKCHDENAISLCSSHCPLQRVFDTGQPIPRLESNITTRWGDERRISSSYFMVRSASMDGRRVVTIVRDITELKDLEKRRTDSLALVSHELRTPLAAVKGAAAKLLATCDPSRIQDRDFIEIIREQGERLESLMSNFLHMSKMDSGVFHLESRPTSLSVLLREVAREWQLRNTQHPIEASVPSDLPLVNIDTQRTAQVFSNLLENACKYSPFGTPIAIQADGDRNEVHIKVLDSGVGIPSAEVDKIFEKFYRVENDLTRITPGTGLGLWICKAIVEAQGGGIWAESELGQGTIMHITFPTARAIFFPPGWPAGSTKKMLRSVAPVHYRPKVLVVDDEPAVLHLLRIDLESAGLQVMEDRYGRSAVQVVQNELPDAILLDLMLPDLDGLEVCRRIRQFSVVPIIILSARDGEEIRVKCLENGADDYVAKPFSSRELVSRLKAHLRRNAGAAADEMQEEDLIVRGNLVIDSKMRRVLVRGDEVNLTDTEYKLLRTLASNQNRTFTHSDLLRRVWGPEYVNDTQYLWVHLHNLRKKIEPDPAKPEHIVTVHGVGYRFV